MKRTKSGRIALVIMIVVVACVLGLTGGCGDKQESDEGRPADMTTAERDSAIAESILPGAGVVGRALDVADSARARARRMDQLSDE